MTIEAEVIQAFDWGAFAEKWGYPSLLLIGVGYGIYRGLRWLAPRIDKLVDSHIALVDSLKDKLAKLESNSNDANEILSSIEKELWRKKE